MEDTLEELGASGSIQRPVYNAETGTVAGPWGTFAWDYINLNALAVPVKLALVPLASVQDLDGAFKAQRFAIILSDKLLARAGWIYGMPQKGDLVASQGQTLIVEQATTRGLSDDLFYYCQAIG